MLDPTRSLAMTYEHSKTLNESKLFAASANVTEV